jgi:hypothetical protein
MRQYSSSILSVPDIPYWKISSSRKVVLRGGLFVIILIAALALRLYKIDTPLWLDEIYGYRLAKLGFTAIIQNSWTDPHPPLYYLIHWVVSGFGQVNSEIGWRWLPLLSGTLAIFVIGSLVREIVDYRTSIMVCVVAATSPSLIFYSQEARPFAFLLLLSSLSMWLTITIFRNPSTNKLWIAWTSITLVGLYSGYAYLMVAGIQIVFLGFYYYQSRVWRVSIILVSGGLFALLPFAASSLRRVALQHISSEPITFWRTLQTVFAGESLRYGVSLSHTVFPLLVVGLCVIAVIRAKKLQDYRLGYCIIQVTLPMGLFFALSPLLGIRLPLPEAKQFVILMPALFVLIASGFAELRSWQRHGFFLALVIGGVMVLLNASGLQSYWSHYKSPEGFAVLRLRDNLQPGEGVVSLHYSLTYALGFYTANTPIYLNPKQDGATYWYQMTESEHVFDWFSREANEQGVEDIQARGRFWILAHSTLYRESMASLISGCRLVEQETFFALNNSFEITLVECVPPNSDSASGVVVRTRFQNHLVA